MNNKSNLHYHTPLQLDNLFIKYTIWKSPETFIDWKSWAIFGTCLICCRKKVNPILLIVLSAMAGIILY